MKQIKKLPSSENLGQSHILYRPWAKPIKFLIFMNILQLFKMCNSVVKRGIKKRLCYENILFIELKATLLSLPPCERANQNLELIIHENETVSS